MPIRFAQPIGLLALLSLIPLIILYLIRNKPKKKNIPSLMFLMKDTGHLQKLSFLKRFFRNLLFLIQVLMLLLLSMSIAAPIINMRYDATSEYTVIVVDGSGSMSTKVGLTTRFERALSNARNELSGSVSIILAQETPLIVLEQGTKSDANDILSKLTPRATATNLEDSMILALDLLKGERGKVVVLSDFVTSKLDDLSLAKRTLTARGNKVKFVDVKEEMPGDGNIGIINLEIDKKQTKVFVKNYNDKEANVNLLVEKDKEQLDKRLLNIMPNSIETVSFDTVPGVSMVRLEEDDDLDLDNIVYMSTPKKKEISVLLITNKDKTSLQYALESSRNIKFEKVELPVVPNFEHDVIILHKFDRKLFLPGTFEDISRYVAKGGVFVLTIQDDLNEIDISKLNLVQLKEKKKSSIACIDTVNVITKDFGNNKCFAQVSNFFSIQQPKDSLSIISAEDSTPLVLIKGNLVFYNINDDYSDFNTMPAYPIFWDNLLQYMMGEENINDLNVPAGTIKVIEQQDVKTPYGTVNTNKIVMDHNGLYELSDKVIAANMLNEQESDIYNSKFKLEENDPDSDIKSTTAREDFNIENPIIFFIIFLIIFELVYIKFRGDI